MAELKEGSPPSHMKTTKLQCTAEKTINKIEWKLPKRYLTPPPPPNPKEADTSRHRRGAYMA